MSENGQTSTALATIEDPPHAPMAKRERDRLEFTAEQETMIRDMYMSGANPLEASVLLEIAKSRRLDPLKKQIHFVKRKGYDGEPDKWTAQVAIDGFRSIANDTGLYDGQDEPEIIYDADGYVIAAKVRVYRRDIGRAFVGYAHFSEYCQLKSNGDATKMWAKMPRTMIAKCAEALALRKAFPEELGGLYTTDEMGQAENDPASVVRQVHSDPEPPARNAQARPAAKPAPDASIVDPLLVRLKGADNAMIRAVWDDADAAADITPKGRAVVRAAAITQWTAIAETIAHCDGIAKLIKEQGFPAAAERRMLDALNSKARTLPDEGDDPDDTREPD